jgi:septal ring factor EnvC (AmiA/AmiB activator)
MAKLIIYLFLFYQLSIAEENIVHLNQKIDSIHSQVYSIQKSLDENKLSQENISEQLAKTKNILSNFESHINLLNNKKLQTKAQLQTIQLQLESINHKLILSQNIISKNMQNLLSIRLKSQQNLLLATDDSNNNIAYNYLNKILQYQINIHNQLKANIKVLNQSANRLIKLIDDYNNSLEDLHENQSNYHAIHQVQYTKYKQINNKISEETKKINRLKATAKLLNDTLQNIIKTSEQKYAKSHLPTTSHKSRHINYVLPIASNIKIRFGQKHDGIVSKGILFDFIKNHDVVSIDDGEVVFIGNLNGLGSVVIIEHRNNLVSIYCGVVPTVSLGNKIRQGQPIANTGSSVDKNLNGIYFELRDRGDAINLLQ